MNTVKAFDTLSDRRDLYQLLKRLDGKDGEEVGNERRKCFLMEVVMKVPIAAQARLLDCRGFPTEVYRLLTTLSAQYRIDLFKVAVDLEKWIRVMGY